MSANILPSRLRHAPLTSRHDFDPCPDSQTRKPMILTAGPSALPHLGFPSPAQGKLELHTFRYPELS